MIMIFSGLATATAGAFALTVAPTPAPAASGCEILAVWDSNGNLQDPNDVRPVFGVTKEFVATGQPCGSSAVDCAVTNSLTTGEPFEAHVSCRSE